MIITILVEQENSKISGRREETDKKEGITNGSSKSNLKFQSAAECKIPLKPLRDLDFWPSLTNLMNFSVDDLLGL